MRKCRVARLNVVVNNPNLPIFPTGDRYLYVTPPVVWTNTGLGNEGTFSIESNTNWSLE